MSTSIQPTRPGGSSAAPATPARTSSSRGGWLGLGLAALVAVVGVTTAIVWSVTGILDQTQVPAEFVRADLPGAVSVVLNQPGPHVVYYEGAEPNALSAGQIEVTRADGTVVTVRPFTLDLRYDVPGRPGTLGTAIAVFDADRTGSYLIGTETKVADTSAQLAVGDDLAPATVRAVLLPGLAALLSVIAAIALAARTWSGRERRNQP